MIIDALTTAIVAGAEVFTGTVTAPEKLTKANV
jgi:hypothetical protein